MDYKPTLEVLQGLPASGKTTHARKLVQQGNWVRINKDDLRAMMDESVHSSANEKRVIRTRNNITIDALANGKNVVIDDTNLNPVHIKELSMLAEQMGANFHVTFLDTPLEDCLARNASREKKVPENVIWDMYNKYLKPKGEERVKDEELEECIIVDIDGTLAHITGDNPRSPYDGSRAMEDSLDDAVASVAAMSYQNGYKVIILTGRNDTHRKVTEEWLEYHGISYDELYTRNSELDVDEKGQAIKDTIVKQRLFDTHIKNRFNVKFVIDDRPSVCRMWRENGLKVLQVGDPHVEF